MNPELERLFSIASTAVLPAWLLLVFAPNWQWTQRLVHALWLPVLLGALYLWLAFTGPPAAEGAGFGSLAAVMLLFDNPHGALAGWVHYLVFDLFVGAWESRDAQRRGIPHLAVVPALLLTFVLGPIGLLLYLVIRFFMCREWLLAEETPSESAE